MCPFTVSRFLALNDIFLIALQLLVLQPKIERRNEDAPSLKSLISDPYILIASGKIDENIIHNLDFHILFNNTRDVLFKKIYLVKIFKS